MNAYILLLSFINFYKIKIFDYAHSFYKTPVCLVTFFPKYTNDDNLWTSDKLKMKSRNDGCSIKKIET